jgi:multidrug efflux system membrane fusion protein
VKKQLAIVVIALCSTAILSCKTDAGASKGAGGKGGAVRALTFPVDVIEVEAKQVDYVVLAPGSLEAFERVQVTSRVAGVVDRVAFTEGQEVKKGDLLVVIESERYQLAVNSAKATVAKTAAALADAEAMVTSREKASAEHPGLIPAEELATYKTKALTANADAMSASEALKVAMVNLRDAYVRAPIAGVMQTRTVETGQYVTTGVLMATLLRQEPMLLRFQVEPKDAPRLKPGMIANFTLRETQRLYEAKITLVAASAEAATHTVGVTAEVVVADNKYWLRPGSFCDVAITIPATRDAVLIPRTAARATTNGYIVYVVEDEVAIERPVTLGMNTKDGRIEVRSGLKPKELLVIRGAEALTTGAKVKATKGVFVPPSAQPSGSAHPPSSEASAPASGSASAHPHGKHSASAP